MMRFPLDEEASMASRLFSVPMCVIALALAGAVPTPAAAQDRVGGHFGFVIPLWTRANDRTTTVADDFVIGFPTGITLHTSDRIAFDLELSDWDENIFAAYVGMARPAGLEPAAPGLEDRCPFRASESGRAVGDSWSVTPETAGSSPDGCRTAAPDPTDERSSRCGPATWCASRSRTMAALPRSFLALSRPDRKLKLTHYRFCEV
jgi:hypothetical protein